MKEIILLTGAGGFIGKHLDTNLRKRYRVIRILSPGISGGRSDLPEQDLFAADLASASGIERLIGVLPAVRYKAVIHTAAVLCKPGHWKDRDVFDLNNQITYNMIRLLETLDCDCLINFSSLAVYPVRTGSYSEESAINMSGNTECLYGLAKFCSEMFFNSHLKSRTRVINLRLTQAYGPSMRENLLVGKLHKELMERNKITLFGNGERIGNFIHVDDVVQSVLKVLEKPVDGIYNLGHHGSLTYHKLAEEIITSAGNAASKIILVEKGIRAKVEIDTRKFERCFNHICRKRDFSFLQRVPGVDHAVEVET